MSSEIVIDARGLSKTYQLYARPMDRLKQLILGRNKTYYREFRALQQLDLQLCRGEVLGVIGRNGAGKSTLLQLLCGTLSPSAGSLRVTGRVAALLELGAGFNPEFSGRENIYLNASVLGLSKAEIDARYDDIVAFSGIGEFIHQPVKTYSSGMYVRLAFAIATSVEPDILIIDEALSVGDGAFARKSFDRIMQLKAQGATILFCSHSMYHIEAICNRALWLDKGRVVMMGAPAEVSQRFLLALAQPEGSPLPEIPTAAATEFDASAALPERIPAAAGTARITRIQGWVDDLEAKVLPLHSGRHTLRIRVEFASDPALATPAVAMSLDNEAGDTISSCGSFYDGVVLSRDAEGFGAAELVFPALPLLKGRYTVNVFLACEQLLHVYEAASHCLTLEVSQTGIERGYVQLPHQWESR